MPKLVSMTRSLLIATLMTLIGSLTSWQMPVHAEPSDSLTAETWYKVGMGYLKEEKFLSAGDAFHQAYGLAGDPALLYNAARSYEKGGQLERAKKLYLEFTIQEGVEKARKEKAVERIQAIDSQLMNRKPIAPTNLSASRAQEEPAAYWKWIAIGSGLAFTVAMSAMVGVAESEREELSAKLQEDSTGQTSGVSQFDAFAIRDRVNTLETTALVCGIVGSTLLVTGIGLWVFGEETTPVALGPLHGGLLLSAGGTF